MKRISNRSDIMKDPQTGAILASKEAYQSFQRTKQREQRVNNVEKRLDNLEAKVDRLVENLEKFVGEQ